MKVQTPRSLGRRLALPVLLVIGVALAACSSAASPTVTTSASASTAAETGTGPTALKPGKVAVLCSTLQSTSEKRTAGLIQQSLSQVGWSTTISDGQNSPDTYTSLMSNFVSQHYSAIVTLYIDAAQIAQPLAAAKAANIPVLSIGAAVPDPTAFGAVFNPNNLPKMSSALTSYVKGKVPADAQFAYLDESSIYGAHVGVQALTQSLKTAGYASVGSYDTNPADLTNSIRTGALNLLSAHPQIKLLLVSSAIAMPIVVPALAQAGHGDVLVVGIGQSNDLPSLSLIGQGDPLVAVVVNADLAAYSMVDQILAHAASGAAFNADSVMNQYQVVVVDKDNAPPNGQQFQGTTAAEKSAFSDSDLNGTYLAKWSKEYHW